MSITIDDGSAGQDDSLEMTIITTFTQVMETIFSMVRVEMMGWMVVPVMIFWQAS